MLISKKKNMRRAIQFFAIVSSTLFFSQRPQIAIAQPPAADPSVVIFAYDDSGNQIFRGPDGIVCVSCRPSEQTPSSVSEIVANNIKAGPVPVKDNLTVIWDLSIQDYIVSIELLPYNAFTIYEAVNIRSLPSNSYVFKMGHLPYGVYYLRFNLSDGGVYNRTVTKN